MHRSGVAYTNTYASTTYANTYNSTTYANTYNSTTYANTYNSTGDANTYASTTYADTYNSTGDANTYTCHRGLGSGEVARYWSRRAFRCPVAVSDGFAPHRFRRALALGR